MYDEYYYDYDFYTIDIDENYFLDIAVRGKHNFIWKGVTLINRYTRSRTLIGSYNIRGRSHESEWMLFNSDFIFFLKRFTDVDSFFPYIDEVQKLFNIQTKEFIIGQKEELLEILSREQDKKTLIYHK